MRLGEIIALILAVVGLGGAFQTFFTVDFYTKLIALAVAASTAVWIASGRLADWIRRKSNPRLRKGSPHLRKMKLLAATCALGTTCFAASSAGYLIVRFYAINIDLTVASNDKAVLWISGARQVAAKLTVLVPPPGEFRCEPVGDSNYPAASVMYNWDSSNPQLQISNFCFPQRQGLSCGSRTSPDYFIFRVEPPNLDVLSPRRRGSYQTLILALGGALWISSTIFVSFRSR
jgi:hypothetical protein